MKRAAQVRVTEADIRRAFNAAYARHLKEWREWKAKQIAVAAGLLNLPPEQVTDFQIGFCTGWFGKPDLPEPKIRTDRRFAAIRGLSQARPAEDRQAAAPAEEA